jgi:SAM-dependent methyltransferase
VPARARRSSSFYGDDLAHVQQQGFGDFVAGAAPALLATLRRAGIRDGTVVDLGCGAGPWLRELARAGYDAVGVEISPSLAAHARRAAPRARVVVGSIYDVELPRCDAVTALGEVLGYLPDGVRIPSLASYCARVARALRPGGVFAFDLIVRNERSPLHTRNYRTGRDWAVFAETLETPATRRLTRDITVFRRLPGGAYRRSHELHRVRVPSRDEIMGALRRAGFTARASRRLGAHALAPHRLAFVARKAR